MTETIETEDHLEEALSRPTAADVDAMRALDGDLLLLGVGGKMGPSLARLARRASDQAGVRRRIIGVSRFSEPGLAAGLQASGIETIPCDLADRVSLQALHDCPNVIFMTGRKFGSTGQEWLTWAMNVLVPAMAAERYRSSRIVVFSSGNVYPYTRPEDGGPAEDHPPGPVGEYAQSALGRERVLEFLSRRHGTSLAILRLNYAIEPRYGVLRDVADRVLRGEPVDLAMGYVNVIWQRDANSVALRAFAHCAAPPFVLNVTGPDTVRIRDVAERFGRAFGRTPTFVGVELGTALLSNAARCAELFGTPEMTLDGMIEAVAEWVRAGGKSLGKPTHYQERQGGF